MHWPPRWLLSDSVCWSLCRLGSSMLLLVLASLLTQSCPHRLVLQCSAGVGSGLALVPPHCGGGPAAPPAACLAPFAGRLTGLQAHTLKPESWCASWLSALLPGGLMSFILCVSFLDYTIWTTLNTYSTGLLCVL